MNQSDCHCSSESTLDNLKSQFFMDKILITIQKNCGYQLLAPVQQDGSINDVYRYVDLYYNHIQPSLNLYFIRNNVREFIPRSDTPLKQFINNYHIRPYTKIPEPVVYKFILDLC
jgi:hypothetical protein